MTVARPIRLSVPLQKRDQLSFCDGTPSAIAAWAEPLHALPADEAIATLLPAVTELNQCRAEPERRFEQLEAVRPVAWFLCTRLAQATLTRPLLLDAEEQTALANAQSLQTQLAAGYKLVVAHALKSGQPLVSTALHRALSDLGPTLLRALQLYTPAPPRLWEQLHQLFYLAERKGLLDRTVVDPVQQQTRPLSIRNLYLRLLLLGCARPNMLRQQGLLAMFNALEGWAEEVELATGVEDAHLLVDLTSDQAPLDVTRYVGHSGEDLRCLVTEPLLEILRRRFDAALKSGIETGADDPELLSHLIQAWGRSARRGFKRSRANGNLEICVGLPALHFHSAGGIPLRRQLRGGRDIDTPAAEGEDFIDPFAGAGDVGGARMDEPGRQRGPFTPEASEPTEDYPVAKLRLEDISPGGYGLIWESRPDADLQAGELVGLRTPGDPYWSVAVVRWCRNVPGELRLGVELLAPRAASACVRPLGQQTAWNAWGPALVLPEVGALSQPPYLITPSGSFAPGQKVILNRYGTGLRARLQVLERASHGFAEYRFEELGGQRDVPQDTGIEVEYLDGETAFDQAWSQRDSPR